MSDQRYFRGTLGRLHVVVYRTLVGPVPRGWHVHHVDGDWSNNDVSNLRALTPGEHVRLHPCDPEKLKRALDKAREAAKAWHRSDEGREWHRVHAREIAATAVPKSAVCTHCGTEYTGFPKSGNGFCSNNCKSAFRRDSRVDDEVRVCPMCKEEFRINRYRRSVHCGRKCGMASRLHRQGVQH